jgi:predicted enzyme related to lactoylglutathione lyase
MGTKLANITFDCKDPLLLSQFWSNVFDRPVGEGASEFFAQLPSVESAPNWFFIHVSEDKTVKNRMHIDLESDDMENETQRLVDLGATHVGDIEESGHAWSVFNDPEGNEFCVSGAHS